MLQEARPFGSWLELKLMATRSARRLEMEPSSKYNSNTQNNAVGSILPPHKLHVDEWRSGSVRDGGRRVTTGFGG